MICPSLPPVDVSRETTARLNAFVAVLIHWLPTVNLVGKAEPAHLWQRHVLDSLQLLPLLPPTGDIIDLGAGAGFPGLILSIAADRPVHLVEADHRKAAFLREAARITQAPACIHTCRIEQLTLPPARLITARAVAPLSQLLRWAAPRLAPDGECVFPKGRTAEHELTQAAPAWTMRVTQWQSRTKASARILQISELAPHAGADA